MIALFSASMSGMTCTENGDRPAFRSVACVASRPLRR